MLPICIAFLWGSVAGAQPRPQRVVSLNLCTDEMLLTLADRDQIASLSFLIKDPSISFMTGQAQGLPVNDGRAETILFSGPDLVLSGTYGQQGQVALLKAQGLEVLTLGPWTSLNEGQEQIRTMARALGHPERGEALIARIDAALQRTKDIVQGRPSILVYDRGSWVSSTDSPMNELLIHMGFKPHQEALGLPHGGMARLEAIVTTPPDFLLLDDDSDKAVDNGTALFVHPALVQAVPLERRLVVPRKLTICGGPSTPGAIEALAAEVRAKVR
ncbi:Fe3+-hydroxamate ABC transporter substrate-binding protein [Microvirga vignae]|uniref:Fe3+-hydroxamate ABC transporter substrate-binding protein n=1 Tax=Microvirga vignae TaxID=1225564 RepID=A0A0H1RDG2_9HYPH|nr:Fe3+-hydroxamate ABC transporter substrate-binding protein [Microvirga vignae]